LVGTVVGTVAVLLLLQLPKLSLRATNKNSLIPFEPNGEAKAGTNSRGVHVSHNKKQ
jgi:hypothetical protein